MFALFHPITPLAFLFSEFENMNTMTLHVNAVNTMTSREIAELTGKRHDHVKRDCEIMFAELGIDVPKSGDISGLDALSFKRIYFDSMNREQTEYALTRDLVHTLITGYSIKLRHAVVVRLNELESQNAPRRGVTFDSKLMRVTFANCLATAKMAGMSHDEAIHAADSATVQAVGVSPIKLLGISTLHNKNHSNIQRRILQMVNCQEGMLSGVICNRFRDMEKQEIKAILKNMLSAGLIRSVESVHPSNKRIVKRYFAAH